MSNNHYYALFISYVFPTCYMYNFDWPQALSTPLQQKPYYYSLTQIDLIYIFTMAGAILLCFKLGMMYDRMALPKTLLIVPSVAAISHLVICFIYYLQVSWGYYVVIGARVFFGLSGESFWMLQASFLVKLYGIKAMPYIGFGIAGGILGSPINSFVTPLLYEYFKNIYGPLFIGGLLNLGGILCGYLMGLIVKYHKRITVQEQKEKLVEDTQQIESGQILSVFQQIKQFGTEFWCIQLMIFLINSSTASFISLGTDLIVKRFEIPYVNAGLVMTIPYCSGIVSTVVWYMFTKSIRRMFIMIAILNLLLFIGLYLLPNCQASPPNYYYVILSLIMTCNGIVFGGYLMNIIPSINMLVPQRNIGAAYGAVSICAGMAFVLPYASALVVRYSENVKVGYRNVSFLFIGLAIVSLALSLAIRLSSRFDKLDSAP